MLRKRSRPFQKDDSRSQMMADLASDSSPSCDNVVHKARGSPFFTVPGLFVGFTAKGTDSDSARSPTSPLDYRVFANLGSSLVRSPRSPAFDGHPKSWDCHRVGLGLSLVDSLNDGKALGSSESRSILFGSQMRINQAPSPKTHLNSLKDAHVSGTSPKSLPIGSPKFEIVSIDNESAGSGPSSFPRARGFYHNISKSNSEVFSPESKNTTQLGSSPLVPNLSGSLPIPIGNGNGFMGSLSASEIELSEDYTCIISHGPNPKTTHIFGDCILDGDSIRSLDHRNNKSVDAAVPSDDFLSYCFSCRKKLEQGEDIYMYRGEKAFCSGNCRDQEILSEEEMEKPAAEASADCLGSSFHEEIFMALAS